MSSYLRSGLAVLILAVFMISSCRAATHIDINVTAAAYFNLAGFKGVVVVSPNVTSNNLIIDATRLSLAPGTHRLAVYELPVFAGLTGDLCSNIGEVYNPTSASNGQELGSLAGLNDLQNTTAVEINTDLHMFDPYGVVGRALVIRNIGGQVVSCANLEHVTSKETATEYACSKPSETNYQQTYVATFNGDVSGRVIFRQLKGSSLTTVFSHMFSTQGRNSTTGHEWNAYSRLSAAQGTPPCGNYRLGSLMANLSTTNSHRLGVGHGPSGHSGKRFSSVVLAQSLADLSRSAIIAIHSGSASEPILACARLYRQHQRAVRATFTGRYEGTVDLSQGSPFSPVSLDTWFSSSPVRVNINTLPVENGQCAAGRTVYNPATRSPTTGVTTPDAYAAGALVSKLGSGPHERVCDGTVTLRGLNSMTGRSAAVVDASGEAVACANLMEQLEAGDRMLMARAVFSSGVTGTIYMSQVVHNDGSMGETTLFSTGLTNTAGASMNHNMHVHVGRVGYQRTPSACGGPYTGGHYDPFRTSANKGLYSAQCSRQHPLRCELGDTSKKTGQFNLDGQSFVRHDTFLPLMGEYSVIGRSFVIHEENGGGPRVACANIVPDNARVFSVRVPVSRFGGRAIDRASLFQRIRNYLTRRRITANLLSDYVDTYNTSDSVYIHGVFSGNGATMASQQINDREIFFSSGSRLSTTHFLSLLAMIGMTLFVSA